MDISAYQHMNIRMATRGKRPLRNLTPSDKVRAIQRIHNGETKASVSRDIGVPESTLRGWCKNEQKLRFMCRQLNFTEQFSTMQGLENPPEKRIRFNNHIQTPKFAPANSFDEFVYSRLPVNGLPILSNGKNTILEKVSFNDLLKKQGLADAKCTDQASTIDTPNVNNQLPVDYAHPSVLQNLNLLSLLYHRTNEVSTYAAQGTVFDIKPLRSLNTKVGEDKNEVGKKDTGYSARPNANPAVMNWAKDHLDNVLTIKGPGFNINPCSTEDTKSKPHQEVMPNTEALSNSTPLEGLFEIPNILNSPDSENNNILEWCKMFNASLNFIAMAAAATALYPNATTNSGSSKNVIVRSLDNLLYKEHKKFDFALESHMDSDVLANSDQSSDSFFDSEPEDLSTSKLSQSCCGSQSPVKNHCSNSEETRAVE